MFTVAERVQIRKYLGYASIYLQQEPRLENAITGVQSIADGGSQPDNSVELLIRDTLAKLAQIDAAILDEVTNCIGNVKIGNITQDNVRGVAAMRAEGRRYVGYLADPLSTRPVRDVFSPPGIRDGIHRLEEWPS